MFLLIEEHLEKVGPHSHKLCFDICYLDPCFFFSTTIHYLNNITVFESAINNSLALTLGCGVLR
jgi:hypothetical protein